MNPLRKKKFNLFVRVLIYIMSAACTAIPIIVAAVTNNVWVSVLLILPCLGQLVVAFPVVCALKEYYNAYSKRGLIHEDDIYGLFQEDGTAKLHVADIDQLPRYNVDISE